MPIYKLTYFNMRGRAEVSRFLFALAGQEYEDIRIPGAKWRSDETYKNWTPFGQMPVLEVDGELLCQSHAIESYLATKFGYAGKTKLEHARCVMILECLEEVLKPMFDVKIETNEQVKKEKQDELFNVQLPSYLVKFDRMLQDNGYFVGDSLTYADLSVLEHFNQAIVWAGRDVDWQPWPRLKAHRNMVENIPALKAWLESRPLTKR